MSNTITEGKQVYLVKFITGGVLVRVYVIADSLSHAVEVFEDSTYFSNPIVSMELKEDLAIVGERDD